MGDRATLAKAKKELEELYMGVPDESVNLTFQDLAQVRQHNTEKKKPEKTPSVPLAKLPSIDFNKGLEASFQGTNINSHHQNQLWGPRGHVYGHHDHPRDPAGYGGGGAGDQRSMVYEDDIIMSHVSVVGGRRRPGVPHSNICTLCSNYIYLCRHRCLVCGRAYCRQCVSIGMGEMTEGRKCIDCLGRRFSQRYIQKAGHVGCCIGYTSVVKQQELKWAEKGPRRTGDNKYGNSMMTTTSRSRSPISRPATPTRPQHNSHHSNPPSFVMSSPYSPYSPTNHHPMPF
ncbi:hypothetical protein DH2020_000712 [Rehmannia glutinosa]|uniref:Uncharacterized protein n=1 Tax=Rehmannia glutinosa TaxID=99300 RepID=A0ABR0XXD9_REHGL